MANAEASKFTGSSYSAEVLIGLLEAELSDMCKEHGYLQAKVHVSPLSDPVVKSNGSYISLMATIEPGPQYKLGAIVLSPGQLVTQADFDRQSTLRKGQVVTPRELRAAWERLKSQYHRRGYMQAQVEAVPSYQSEQNRVNYTVNVVSGQVYTMGSFSVECDDDAIRDSLTKAWKLKPGAVFDESAASTLTNASFESIVGKYRTGYTLRYSLQLNKENRTVDVVVRFEEAPHS
jgi:outer membrane protein assembly factor BamA